MFTNRNTLHVPESALSRWSLLSFVDILQSLRIVRNRGSERCLRGEGGSDISPCPHFFFLIKRKKRFGRFAHGGQVDTFSSRRPSAK